MTKGVVGMNLENLLLKRFLNKKGMDKREIEEAIKRIEEERAKATPGTEEWRRLSVDLEQEMKNMKALREARKFGLSWDTIAIIVLVLGVSIFGFALDLESPKALKIASYVLKMPGVRLKI